MLGRNARAVQHGRLVCEMRTMLGTLNRRREGDGLVHASCASNAMNALNGVAVLREALWRRSSCTRFFDSVCAASAARVCLGSSSLVNSTMNLRAGRRLEQFGGFIERRFFLVVSGALAFWCL